MTAILPEGLAAVAASLEDDLVPGLVGVRGPSLGEGEDGSLLRDDDRRNPDRLEPVRLRDEDVHDLRVGPEDRKRDQQKEQQAQTSARHKMSL